jgi:predicted amidohydrolase
MKRLRVALAQMAPVLGNVGQNLAQHLALMDQAAAQGAQLILFPELSLTGYYVRDLVAELACRPSPDDPYFGALLAKTAEHQLEAIIGFIEEDPRGRFYIAAAYLSRGAVLHVHRKVYLPTYTIFDDGRYFAAGDTAQAFDTPYGRFGMLICEDFWHVSLPYILWQNGADVLFFLNASPARGITQDQSETDMTRWLERVCRVYAGLFTNFVLACNRVGYEDGICFGGASQIADPRGELLLACPDFEAQLAIATLDLNDLRRVRAQLPLLRDERPELLARDLTALLQKRQS